MTRPAFVIGLGGTGQWVLTYLKKDLIESNDGRMPENVRLLCFDTMPQVGAEVAGSSVRRGEKEVKVGSIALDKGTEFVPLGGDVYELAQAVAGGKLSHIGSWYRAKHWLANLPQASFVLSAGAGQLRQFGRIALYKDLSALTQSEVWRRLDAYIGQLDSRMEGEQRLEIIIVGSFAGGTGSGLFVDLALLARHRAKKVSNLIRGYFVLPRAFDPDADDDMLARSFAAWRELNRFMVVSPDFSISSLIYNSRERALQLREVKTKVFDACYLMDGVRGGARVAAEAELGVHPTVADAIGAILDDTAGRAYTEWVVQNLAPTYATNPGVPLYSTLGTHTLKVPVYYSQREFSHRLTLNWLDTLLKPIRDDPQARERVTRIDATNPEDPARTGRDDAFALLRAEREYQGQSEAPTLFLGRIADVVMEGGADNASLIEEHARGSLGRRRGRGYTWLENFTDLGDRADIADLVQRVRQEARLRVTQAVKPSKELKTSPAEWPRYVERNLPPWVREHYGYRTAAGEESRGKFGEILDECSRAQLDIAKRLTQLWLQHTLMSGDKAGRLGFAYDLLDGLLGHLDDFLAFMDRVQAKRQEVNPRLDAENDRNRRRQAMLGYARRKFLLFFDHPRAHTTQVAYLQAEQDIVDTRKDELLHRGVVQTARSIKAYYEEVRDELTRWIRLLATGDPATGVEALYAVLASRSRETEQTRLADERLTAIQTRVGELEYPEQEEQAELERLMAGVMWQIDEGADGFEIHLSVEPPDEPATQLERLTGRERPELRQHLTQRNLDMLQGYAYRRFGRLPEETRVAERLRQEFGTSAAFLEAVGMRAEPLFDRQPGEEGGPAKWSELIRVSVEEVDPATAAFFKEGVVRERRQSRGLNPDVRDQDQLVEVVGSADPHKCTVVRTDDLLRSELFRAWHDCQDAYLRNREMPPHLNHIFPADANAARYELKYAERHRMKYRVFHPWVVMLLEHPDRLEQFFLCWGLGWTRVQDDGAQTWYELGVPGFQERYSRPFMLTPRSESLASAFQAARAFVLEGLDQAPQSAWALDYKEIREALEAEERDQGSEEWVALLQKQVAQVEEGGPVDEQFVIRWLRHHTRELDDWQKQGKELPAGEPADYGRAYTDLADVAELMFEERLERKGMQLSRRAQ